MSQVISFVSPLAFSWHLSFVTPPRTVPIPVLIGFPLPFNFAGLLSSAVDFCSCQTLHVIMLNVTTILKQKTHFRDFEVNLQNLTISNSNSLKSLPTRSMNARSFQTLESLAAGSIASQVLYGNKSQMFGGPFWVLHSR